MRTFSRAFGGVGAMVLAAAFVPASARADQPLRASVTCDAAFGPGRVRCTADVAIAGEELRWADLEIVEAPDFVMPLKGRLAPGDAARRTPDAWQFGFAVVARGRGAGELVLRARAVACRGDTCRPLTARIAVAMQVG